MAMVGEPNISASGPGVAAISDSAHTTPHPKSTVPDAAGGGGEVNTEETVPCHNSHNRWNSEHKGREYRSGI
jgi:hypothetical protein